jgi:hypothetical protein
MVYTVGGAEKNQGVIFLSAESLQKLQNIILQHFRNKFQAQVSGVLSMLELHAGILNGLCHQLNI